MNGTFRFIVNRLVSAALTLLGLVTIVFLMTRMIPGDEARVVAGSGASAAQVEQVTRELGLNRSVLVQYLTYVGRLLHGNLGISSSSNTPVLSGVMTVLPNTLQLIVVALLIAWSVAIPAAAWSAFRVGGVYDTTSRIMVVVAAGLPTFWLGLLLQWLLGAKYAIFPVSGAVSTSSTVPRRTGLTIVDAILAGSPGGLDDALMHLILPAVVLSIPLIMQFFRVTRTETRSVLDREHILVARAAGIPPKRILMRHALQNSIGPAITLVGVNVGVLLGSAVMVEEIFGLPGIGTYLFNAVSQKDITAVLGSVVVMGVVVIISNFIVDMVQMIRDPRLRARQLSGAAA